MAFRTLISTAVLASHLDDPAYAIVDCRAKLDDLTWGAREYAAAHIPGAVYADLSHDLSGPKTGTNGRHPMPDSPGAGADLRSSRHHQRRAGRGLRPGQRDVRQPALVAAALAGARRGRRARRRVQAVEGRRTADRERRSDARSARVHRIAACRDGGRRADGCLASRRRAVLSSSTRARRNDTVATPNRSTRSAVTFRAREIISTSGTSTSRDCSGLLKNYARRSAPRSATYLPITSSATAGRASPPVTICWPSSTPA